MTAKKSNQRSSGLTLEEVQPMSSGPFDGLAPGSSVVYTRHLSYLEAWCRARDVELWDVSTVHLRVYIHESHEEWGRSISWVRCAIAAVKKYLEWMGRLGQVDWGYIAKYVAVCRKR